VIFLASFAAFGQKAPVSPEFDAASIKPSKPGDTHGSMFNFTPGGGLTVTNGTLKGLIEAAYDVRDFQISGGPNWLDSERFDLIARSAPEAAETLAPTRQRLQSLLAQRFQLRIHRETRGLPIYMLAVAKNGLKIVATDDSNAAAATPSGIQRSCGQMIGTRALIADLVVSLERQLDRPVQDHAGLSGKYDFRVNWTPDTGPCAMPADAANQAASISSSDAPSLFTALQEQLGLKLESTKGPVEVIVVDQAVRPGDN
jgi:uncharacterized protein (TIGR03435 family)